LKKGSSPKGGIERIQLKVSGKKDELVQRLMAEVNVAISKK
jgi:hypothetical protein